MLQTPESLARSPALDVRTGRDVLRIDRDAEEVEARDIPDTDRRMSMVSHVEDELAQLPGALEHV